MLNFSKLLPVFLPRWQLVDVGRGGITLLTREAGSLALHFRFMIVLWLVLFLLSLLDVTVLVNLLVDVNGSFGLFTYWPVLMLTTTSALPLISKSLLSTASTSQP